MSEVRGRSREDPMPEGRRPRGVTPRLKSGAVAKNARLLSTGTVKSYPSPKSGAAAKRSYPPSEVRGSGREELPLAQGQGQRLGAANPRPRPGAATGRSNPTSKVQWLCGHRRA